MDETERSPLFPWWAWIVLLLLLGAPLVLGTFFQWSHFADYGALLQGVAGSVALLLVWRTLALQREELALQREELKLTREEMRKNTAEQSRQAAQLEGQHAQLQRQGDLIREQMDRQVRPVLLAQSSVNVPHSLKVGARNVGRDRALVTGWQVRAPSEWESALVPILARLQGRLPQLRMRIGDPPPGKREVIPNDVLTLLEIDLEADPQGQSRTYFDALRSIWFRVEYTDIFGQVQPPLEIDLGTVIPPQRVG